MLINLINLTLTGTSGYFNFDILGASHTRFALFMILIFTITETIVMYFFITTGKAIKSAIESGLGNNDLWSRERQLKMKLFPQLMLTIFLVGGWFIHNGAVENDMPTVCVFYLICPIDYVHHLWSLKIKNSSFKEQLSIISELETEES